VAAGFYITLIYIFLYSSTVWVARFVVTSS
jgi:predicted ABC-type ATPase